MAQLMEDCPSCGNEVPAGAPRCKHCFADLTDHWDGSSGRSSGILVGVLLLALVFLAVGGWTAHAVFNRSQLGNVTVDPNERRVVMVYTGFNKEPTTRQIDFDSISSVEMVAGQYLIGGTHWEVFLVLSDQERVLINKSTKHPLQEYANNVAKHTNKSLTIINNVRAGADIRGAAGGPAPSID